MRSLKVLQIFYRNNGIQKKTSYDYVSSSLHGLDFIWRECGRRWSRRGTWRGTVQTVSIVVVIVIVMRSIWSKVLCLSFGLFRALKSETSTCMTYIPSTRSGRCH